MGVPRSLKYWRIDAMNSMPSKGKFDSFAPDDISLHYRGSDVQYCPEGDVHFLTLTVEQIIAFAAKTRVPQA